MVVQWKHGRSLWNSLSYVINQIMYCGHNYSIFTETMKVWKKYTLIQMDVIICILHLICNHRSHPFHGRKLGISIFCKIFHWIFLPYKLPSFCFKLYILSNQHTTIWLMCLWLHLFLEVVPFTFYIGPRCNHRFITCTTTVMCIASMGPTSSSYTWMNVQKVQCQYGNVWGWKQWKPI